MAILAIDAGTTGVTVLVVEATGEITARGYSEFEQHFPNPGWVEHEPEQIWQATLAAGKLALENSPNIEAIGITNQRETVVLWDRETLTSPRRAIVWQDRRTSAIVDDLKASGVEAKIREKTGLGLDPYFTSTKLVWIQQNEPEIWDGVVSGRYAVGTVDSYLVARLTDGASHITDASNASRTQLCNIHNGNWDSELLEVFGVPIEALPTIVPNSGRLAECDPKSFLGISAPITGMAGDQQAALFGQAAFSTGDMKCTYGTGAFLLVNTGNSVVKSDHGLLTTIAWQSPEGEITYALEGSVFVAGSAVQWLRDGLGIIEESKDVEALASQVETSGGVVFVPALTGLGAPWWNPDVRGSIFGITRGTTDAHIARATLEAVAFQVADLVDAFAKDLGRQPETLKVDGGMSRNNLFMQIQADVLGKEIQRAKYVETTGLGAAYLAGLGSGIFGSYDEISKSQNSDRTFMHQDASLINREAWARSVRALLEMP
jgi:glycerol kinase